MPLLTPSRIAVLVVSFSLITFIWTFGLTNQFGGSPVPVKEHYGHGNLHTDPNPPPVLDRTITAAPARITHGDRPAEAEDHRWDDATKKGPSTTKNPALFDGGGKWQDKTKETQGGTPTTLLTAASPVPSVLNATNATLTATSDIPPAPTHAIEKFCMDVRGAPHVMVILRTSKAEVDKLSTHLLGLLSCVPNFAIFSDHSGEIQGHTIHNALESVGSEAKRTHDEFRECH